MARQAAAAPASGRFYYGWLMVVVGSLINGVGSINGAISSVFFLPLTAHLGVGHATLAFALSLARLESGIVGPIAGWLLDRKGPRFTITIGCLMGGVGLLLLPLVNSFLGFLLLYMGVISIGFNMGFVLSMHQVANIWFMRHRTRVLSIFSFSIRFGRAIFVPVLALAMMEYGWQATAVGAGITVLVVALPLSFLVKRSPEAIGQHPDGMSEELAVATTAKHAAASKLGRDFTFREALHERAYWIIVMSTAVRMSINGAIQGQLIPIVVAKGMTPAEGAGLLSAWALTSSGMLLGLGYLADRGSKKMLLVAGHASSMSAIVVLLLAGPTWGWMLLFVVFIAFAEGMAPANHSIIGDMFGRTSFGRLNGMLSTFTTIGVVAPPFLGYSWDRYGNYTLPLVTFAVLAGLGLLIVLFFLEPPKKRPVAPGELDFESGRA